MFCADRFEERAAIMEFCGGMSRFEAETLAAKSQGLTRWQALAEAKEAFGENGIRDFDRGGHRREAMAGGSRKDDLPGVQSKPKEQN
jgi:hypothetical protein